MPYNKPAWTNVTNKEHSKKQIQIISNEQYILINYNLTCSMLNNITDSSSHNNRILSCSFVNSAYRQDLSNGMFALNIVFKSTLFDLWSDEIIDVESELEEPISNTIYVSENEILL